MPIFSFSDFVNFFSVFFFLLKIVNENVIQGPYLLKFKEFQ